jgi:two-component system, NtrC family, nitrogen regulation sensor histidine kinase NtrY
MQNNGATSTRPQLPEDERKRRKRESILIVVIVAVVALLTYAENQIVQFGADIPVSNTILMFILININLLLLILLLFLVFRNLVKLLYDRRRKVMGAKLRTRLVVAFIALTLLPTIILFFFSINFITTSIEFWFNVPVEKALENSLRVGRGVYEQAEENSRFFLERAAYQIRTKKHLDPGREKALSNYIQVVQRAFNFQAVEVYGANAQRITYAVAPQLEKIELQTLASDLFQKPMSAESVRSAAQTIETGELVRTLCTIPFDAVPADARGFVVLTTLVPPRLSRDMRSISRGFEEYQQIKLLKKPIQITYYIALSIVALLVVFCAVWFGFYLAKSITIPIMELAEGTRRVAEGDLSFTIGLVADDEIGSLVDSFNKMTRDLRAGRQQLELSAAKLREQNLEIENRRRYMETVLKNVSTGVISLDADGRISTVNNAAVRMLNLEPGEMIHRNFQDLLTGRHLELAEETAEKLARTPEQAVELPLKLTISGRPRSFLAHLSALADETGQNMGLVMVFDDLTELEKAQRMAAWREVARRIAHEVKNPLTPISLSAQRLKRRYSGRLNEPVFDECTRMIIDHVDLIRNLVNEFSAFARFPTAQPAPCDLAPIIEETVALYREGHEHIEFSLTIPETLPRLSLDRQQIKQAMINLVDNAVAAIKARGRIEIRLGHDPEGKRVWIEVADDGPGIPNEVKTRLFEPDFSTKKTGMGLGLTIVNTIVTDHQGTISVRDNHPRGARFVIALPA